MFMQDTPDALFIGLPPNYHGSLDDPKADIELQLAKVSPCIATQYMPCMSCSQEIAAAKQFISFMLHCLVIQVYIIIIISGGSIWHVCDIFNKFVC